MTTQKPSIVVVSSSNIKPKSLIKLITKHSGDIKDALDSNKVSHPWKIDTKYYTADVVLHGITCEFQRTEDFNNSVEAFIIHADTNKDSGLDDLFVWEVIDKDCEPDIKILLTNYCTNETKITRAKAIEWCLKRGFELIELYPNKKTKDRDEQDLIEEKYGVERVVEVLQTHIWSNLIMKDQTNKPPKVLNNDSSSSKNVLAHKKRHIKTGQKKGVKHGNSMEKSTGGEISGHPISLHDISGHPVSVDADITPTTIPEEVPSLDLISNDGVDDFTELFSQLQMMKESLQSMPMRERKQCAEQMVTAFWKAIGGDEEELGDL